MYTKFWLGNLWDETFLKLKHMGQNNIKRDLREVEFEDVNWTDLIKITIQWQAFVIMVINFWVP